MAHEDLVKRAKEAINKVFNDTSVEQDVTRASLEELQSEIEIMIGGLE